jgi:hypothetical protein
MREERTACADVGLRVVSAADLLSWTGAVVAACERECQRGHTVKQDELTVWLHRQLLKRLDAALARRSCGPADGGVDARR